MQNNLREAGALLSFLVPNVFTDLSLFDDAFSITVSSVKKKVKDVDDSEEQAAQKENKGTIDRDLLTKAHYMMRPFILRRVKGEVEQKLPPKLETKIDCPMTRLQSDLVKYLLYKERELLENLESNNGSNETAEVDQSKVRQLVKRGSQLQSLVMQLRKAANHPFLFDGVENVSWNGLATEEVVQASGKLLVLDQLLKKLKEAGHRVVIFSQFTRMLDIISDFLDLRKYRHTRLDGGTNRVMRDVNIKKFNEPNSEYFVFCLSTRAGGEGVNLHTADTVILYDSDWNPQVFAHRQI